MVEKNHNITLIALDMDGTLLTSDDEVSEANRQAISEAMEKDVQVMLSTGRWLESCYSYAEDLRLNTYLITVNGGEIWTPTNQLLERHLHAPELMEEMWEIGNDLGVFMWLVSTKEVFHERPQDFTAYEWLKIGYSSQDLQKLRMIREKLAPNNALEITNSLPTNIEVNPIGVNKANGLETVCKEMGLTMDEVMAVGDSLNDLKMIEQAGLGIAMGNAQEKVKQVADFITDTNDNDGVAQAIKRFIL